VLTAAISSVDDLHWCISGAIKTIAATIDPWRLQRQETSTRSALEVLSDVDAH
jgi:hypothetical protein